MIRTAWLNDRLKWLRPGLVGLGWIVLTSCSAPRPSPRPSVSAPALSVETIVDAPDLDLVVLGAHNAERTRNHLPPLQLNRELTAAAESHAIDMARRGRMAHRGGDGSSPFDRIERVGYAWQAAAENVAFGFEEVDAVMAGWMKSPGHRRNILGPYSEMGAGRAIGSSGASFWCVTFGTPTSGKLR